MPDGTQERRYALLAGADTQAILARYLTDESTEKIAASFGCTRQALGQFLLKNDTEGWKAAQVSRQIALKEQADDDLAALKGRIDAFTTIEGKDEYEREKEACRLQLSLAQARAKRAEWELERLLSRLYGQKQEVEHKGGLTVEIVKFGREIASQDIEDVMPTPIPTV